MKDNVSYMGALHLTCLHIVVEYKLGNLLDWLRKNKEKKRNTKKKEILFFLWATYMGALHLTSLHIVVEYRLGKSFIREQSGIWRML